MKHRLWLIKNGVPWQVVFGDFSFDGEMPFEWVFALSILFSEMHSGQQFNWRTMQWMEPKKS